MDKEEWVPLKDFCQRLWGDNFDGGLIGMYNQNNEFLISEEYLELLQKDYEKEKNNRRKLLYRNQHFGKVIQKMQKENRVRTKRPNSVRFIK